jgi:uncharacterized protein (DUF1786 family)
MRILTVDIGTGTQDIFLYDSRLDTENGFKLVLPSPTMMVHRRIKAATAKRQPIVLVGRQMGGGPSAWAAQAHARAGLATYSTPEAALTIDDDLEKVAALGIHIVSEDEELALKPDVARIEMKDFDFEAIAEVFARFGTRLDELDAVAVAAFDHGAAPREVSDRQFRFDYLDRRIREKNSLTAFAHLAPDVPGIMSRLRAIAETASGLDCPLILMDSAPAGVLGATYDPVVGKRDRKLIANIGNFHTLAFRLGRPGIEGVFEHHTGEITLGRFQDLLRALADGSLKHEDVFNGMGHGALIYGTEALPLGDGDYDVVVTGPRRSMLRAAGGGAVTPDGRARPPLRPYFAVPFGDMMLAGCFGLLAAVAELLPELGDQIRSSMRDPGANAVAPWDVD